MELELGGGETDMRHWTRVGVLFAVGFLVALPSVGLAVMAPEFSARETLTPEQREALGTLALADASVRDAILEASLQPGKIEEIAALRSLPFGRACLATGNSDAAWPPPR